MDHDLAFNGDLDYTIYGGEKTQASEYFEIDLKTGVVKLIKSVQGHGKIITLLFYQGHGNDHNTSLLSGTW